MRRGQGLVARRDWETVHLKQLSFDFELEYEQHSSGKSTIESNPKTNIFPEPKKPLRSMMSQSPSPSPPTIAYSSSEHSVLTPHTPAGPTHTHTLFLSTFKDYGRLSTAYNSTLKISLPNTTSTSRRAITKLIDLSSFPITATTSNDAYTYTYTRSEARRAMHNEWTMYTEYLKPLQGQIIPKLLGSWVGLDGSGEMEVELMIICLEDAGGVLAVDPRELPDGDK